MGANFQLPKAIRCWVTRCFLKHFLRHREKTECSAKTAGLSKKLFYNGILNRFWANWVPNFDCLKQFAAELHAVFSSAFLRRRRKDTLCRREKLSIAPKELVCQKIYFIMEYCIWANWVPIFDCLGLSLVKLQADEERLFYEPGSSERWSTWWLVSSRGSVA